MMFRFCGVGTYHQTSPHLFVVCPSSLIHVTGNNFPFSVIFVFNSNFESNLMPAHNIFQILFHEFGSDFDFGFAKYCVQKFTRRQVQYTDHMNEIESILKIEINISPRQSSHRSCARHLLQILFYSSWH